jgi:hypothetical protein
MNESVNEYWFASDTFSRFLCVDDCLTRRFAQIISVSPDAKQLHLRWFDHSAKSDLLKEFERPMELFLTNRCVWLSRHHVKRFVEVKFLGANEAPLDREQGYYVR